MYIDGFAYGLLALAVAACVNRHILLFIVLTIVLSFTKEVAILSAIFGLLWGIQKKDKGIILGGGVAFLATTAALITIRIFIVPVHSYSLFTEMVNLYQNTSVLEKFKRLILAISGTWGAFTILATLQIIHPRRIWKNWAFLSLFAGATAQTFIAVNVERPVAYAFPVIIAASAIEIDYLSRRLRISRHILWLSAIVINLAWFVYASMFSESGYPTGLRVLGIFFFMLSGAILIVAFSRYLRLPTRMVLRIPP